MIKILVWTTNPTKIKSIENASKKCVYFEKEEREITGVSVPSGISEMPLSLEETTHGAINRAKNCQSANKNSDYYIGIEWGVTLIQWKAFLVWVVCIMKNRWEYHLGFSPFLEIPKSWERELYENEADLGELTDRKTGEENTGKKDGAMWALSDNMITRSDMFEQAFFCAISPFYNTYYK